MNNGEREIKEYKQREDDINRRLKKSMNADLFIQLLNLHIEAHLIFVRRCRHGTETVLEQLELASKADICELTKAYIKLEARVDELDDTLFTIHQRMTEVTSGSKHLVRAMNTSYESVKEHSGGRDKNQRHVQQLQNELNELLDIDS